MLCECIDKVGLPKGAKHMYCIYLRTYKRVSYIHVHIYTYIQYTNIGVVNVVHGLGPSAGEPIVVHKDVRAVSFTGSGVAGARIASLASKTFKKLQLELGGKNPSIVFDDCYFDETVKGVAYAGMMNTVPYVCYIWIEIDNHFVLCVSQFALHTSSPIMNET